MADRGNSDIISNQLDADVCIGYNNNNYYEYDFLESLNVV